MAGLVAPVVSPLNEVPSGTSALVPTDVPYDYALGQLGFLSAISRERPYRRQTAPYRKEQTDQSAEPGEQSLVYWWLRSQSSFHGGAGRAFAEPTDLSDQDAPIQFDGSAGVDVWTPGKVTLLNATSLQQSAAGECFAVGATDGASHIYLFASGASLRRCTAAGGAGTTITWGGAGTITSVVSDGSRYYAADATGIYRGTLAGGAGAKIWDTGARTLLGWVKQRLMAAVGPSVYELASGGPVLPAAKFTHPNPNWTWTAFAEGPQAIYAAGYAGEQSAVYKFALGADGAVPTLTSGITVAQLPTGEVVHALSVYLGSFVLFGTNRGVRVGLLNGSDMTLGPLSVTLSEGLPPVRSFVGLGDFVYASWSNGIDGKSGLVRLDLGRLLSSGRYAWATDLQAHVTGTVSSVTLLGSSLVFTVDGAGAFMESSALEAEGYLRTGKIRYRTIEPKLFKFLKLRVAPLTGTLLADVTDASGVSSGVASFSGVGQTDLDEVQISQTPQEHLSVTLRLRPSGGVSPEFRGYQLKALPAQKRQRLEIVPLRCFDFESPRGDGPPIGEAGSALLRLQALEALEESGDIVLFQHLTADPGGRVARLVVVDEVRFQQTSPPTSLNGWGGVVEVVLRSVT